MLCSNFISWMLFATIPIHILIINLPILNVSPGNPCKLRNYNTNNLWMFPKIVVPPKSSIFNRVFHYKPSVWGYPYFWKHLYPHSHIHLKQKWTSTTTTTSMTASCTSVSFHPSVMAVMGPSWGQVWRNKKKGGCCIYCGYRILRYTRYLRYRTNK